nr:glycosyltransferase family 4 protein [uncultured Arsenicibacter sp.]
MNILLFSHRFSPDIGGIESISEMFALEFIKAGHTVRVITWTTNSKRDTYLYSVVRKPSFSNLLRQFWWADVVVENNPCTRLSWPNQLFGKPSVISLQTWPSWQGERLSFSQRLKRAWLNRADRLIACSDAIRHGGFSKAEVIPNPYDYANFRRYPEIMTTHDFAFLGRLVSDKGADLAIQALTKLLPELATPATLTIIGDGPERKALEKLVVALGLQPYVQFTGPMRGEALARRLNQHRFLLVPSLWEEPFGIVALEGMACGCVPIVSDGGGLPEAVGDAGLLFRRGDVDALVACMRQVLTDKELVNRLRQAAPAHLEQHTQAQVAKQYLTVIEAAVAR